MGFRLGDVAAHGPTCPCCGRTVSMRAIHAIRGRGDCPHCGRTVVAITVQGLYQAGGIAMVGLMVLGIAGLIMLLVWVPMPRLPPTISGPLAGLCLAMTYVMSALVGMMALLLVLHLAFWYIHTRFLLLVRPEDERLDQMKTPE